jgi:abortive infection bacteriophage resistance protein
MKTIDQKEISRNIYHTSHYNISSWLYCCSNLRNICAHYGRLYYRIFTAIPANLSTVDKKYLRSLFSAIMALRSLFVDKDKWNNDIVKRLIGLFDEHDSVINLDHIGFPTNWKDLISK